MKYLLIFIFVLFSVSSYANKTTAVANGNWNNSSSWDNGVPNTSNDTISIPAAYTITLIQDEDLSSGPTPIYVILDGTLDLGNSGGFLATYYVLSLPTGSAINVSASGKVEGGNAFLGGENLIYAGATKIYDGSNDGVVNGPAYLAADGTVLPIELLSIEAVNRNEGTHINWVTATETNNYSFEIENSNDLESWYSISKILGMGNSVIIQKYNYVVEHKNERKYYRLKQTDVDGKYKYYGPIVVTQIDIENTSINVYPNPTNGSIIYISLYNFVKTRPIDIYIRDLTGKEVFQNRMSSSKLELNISSLPAGMYFIISTDGENQLVEKLIVE